MALSSPNGGSPPPNLCRPEDKPSPISGRVFVWLLISLVFSPAASLRAADRKEALPTPTVSVQGSILVLTFSIPRKPAGLFLHLSLDRSRLLGRKVRPGRVLVLCVGHLPPGRHRVGFELAGANQIVHTDEVGIPVTIPGGSPYSCPSPGTRS